QTLNFARELGNMLLLARVITLGALARNESRGAHYKPEFPDRDDANWLKTTRAKYANGEIKLTYEPVDISLIPPRARRYDAAKCREFMAETKQVILRIKRQASPKELSRWEEFALPWRPSMNVIICLRDIAENTVTREGKKTTPVSYDSNCLEEICGSCAMLINGKARMACSALVDSLEQPIRIEPLGKLPLVRDLVVDRQFMFDSLKRVKAWIPIDGTYDLGEGPRVAPEVQETGYPLSNCISCGSCLEVCPQVNENSKFVGAAIIS